MIKEIKLVANLLTGEQFNTEAKPIILKKYDELISKMFQESQIKTIEHNFINYATLLNFDVYMSVMLNTQITELLNYRSLYNAFRVSKDNNGGNNVKAYKYLREQMVKVIEKNGYPIVCEVTEDMIAESIRTLDLAVAEEVDANELEDMDFTDEEMEAGIFADDVGEVIDDTETDEPSEESAEAESAESTGETEDNDDKSFAEKRDEILNGPYGGDVNKVCNDIAKYIFSVYAPAFTGLGYRGLLVKPNEQGTVSPILQLNSSGNKAVIRVQDNCTATDSRIINAIVGMNVALGTNITSNDDKEIVPSTEQIMGGDGTYAELHLAFETAHINYAKGLISIRKWAREEKGKSIEEWVQSDNSGNKTKITKTKDLRSWYLWCLKNILCKCLIDINFDYKTLADENLDKFTSIVKSFENIKNVIVLTERETNKYGAVKTDIIIGQKQRNAEFRESIKEAIEGKFSTEVSISEMANDRYDSDGILTLSIVFDREQANKPSLFAGDVLDNIIASGNIPSWSHVLLGKKEDGQLLFWDGFMDESKAGPVDRIYTIYAGSRSGKGVMTSTLIASALVDGKQVFYTDGKPENGVTLGMIAWKDGKEAYVFDGQPDGAQPFSGKMEAYTYGVRDEDQGLQERYGKMCPSGLFENSRYFSQGTLEKFKGVMRYLKSMGLCLYSISARSSGKYNELGTEWQIWVFDEMSNMAKNEREIRSVFKKYLLDKGIKELKEQAILSVKDKSALEDDGVQYILNWVRMCNNIVAKIKDATTIQIGKASLNVINIFQEANWMYGEGTEDKEIQETVICHFAKSIPCRKIVGNNGIQPACKSYGDNMTECRKLKSKLATNSLWAISKTGSIGGENALNVEIFKPFNIWTIPVNNKNLLSNGETTSKGFVVQDYVSPEDTRYLYGYIHQVCQAADKDPAEILQSAYDYADNLVRTIGIGESLKEYIYNFTNFGMVEENPDFSKSTRDYEEQVNSDDGVRVDISKGQQWNVESGNTEDEDDKILDFGTDDNEQSGDEVPIENGSKDSEPVDTGVQPDKPLEYGSTEPIQEQETKQPVRTAPIQPSGPVKLFFMTTRQLIDKRFDDSTLVEYVRHFSIINKVLLPNRFDLSNRDEKANNGLYIASIVVSTLHYYCCVRHIDEVMKYKQMLNEIILNGSEGNENAMIYWGLLEDYDNGNLEYDTMPSEEKMRGYQAKFTKAETEWGNMESGPFGGAAQEGFKDFEYGEDNSDYSSAAMPDEVIKVMQPSFSFNNNGDIILNRRQTQEVVLTPPETFIKADVPKYSLIEKMKKKLFESKTGTSYEFKKRWDYVLDAIEKEMPNKSMITRVAIVGQNIAVNGKTLRLEGILGGEYDVRMEDIINIGRLLKRFKSIQELILDSLGMQEFIIEYGANSVGVKNVFDKSKSLRRLGFIPSGEGKPIVYTREGLLAQEAKLQQQLREEELKMKIENAASRKNPRLHEKSPGATAKFFKSSAALSGDTFKKALSMATDKNPKLIRATAVSVVGLGIIGVGSVVGLIGLAGKGIGKLVSLGKR